MARCVRSVVIQLDSLPVVMYLLLAMNVVFQFAVLAMSMSGRMEVNLVLSARPDTKGRKVSLFIYHLSSTFSGGFNARNTLMMRMMFQEVLVLMGMMMRMMLTIWRMSSIILKEITRQDVSGRVKMENFHHPLDMNLNNRFLFSPMAIR